MRPASTEFGRTLRRLRFEKGETLHSLASQVGYSASFLSAVETGSRAVPYDLANRLAKHFRLTGENKKSFMAVAEETKTRLVIDLREATPIQKRAAILFAKRFRHLSNASISRIYELLMEEG